MEKARNELEFALYCRAGELAAHLGRYDMYALLIESTLSLRSTKVQSAPRMVLRARGDSIKALLKLRRIPQSLCDEFWTIDDEMQPIFTRQEICASNVATIGTFNCSGAVGVPGIRKRDWFDILNLSSPDIASFIDRMESDALQVISHYMRLANLAATLREIVTRLH